MAYYEFMAELEQKERSPVYNSLQTIRAAIERCPAQEKTWMAAWSRNLERLTTMSAGEYQEVTDNVFDGLNGMINDYHAPGSLFRDVKVQSAMLKLFSALGLDKKAFDVPGFTQAKTDKNKHLKSAQEYASVRTTRDIEKAKAASGTDPLGYAAQFMAYVSLRDKASPEVMFRAMGLVDRWKEDRTLKNVAQDQKTMADLTTGDFYAYIDGYEAKKKETDEKSLSFKEYSEKIAKDYRAGSISYTQLEMRMKLLRDMTEENVQIALRSDDLRFQFEGMSEPAIRNQIQENTKVYIPDFEAKVEALEKRLKKENQPKTKTKPAYAPGVAPTVKTTAQDIYNDLTKKYKAGQIKYADYENQLKTMRELTGGNKNCKIDLETINKAIEDRAKREASELNSAVQKVQEGVSRYLTGPNSEYDGDLGRRLRGMYDVYGATPKKSYISLRYKGYTEEQFALLEDFGKEGAEQYMKLNGSTPITNDDFAVLSIAVTQTYPKIGGKHFQGDGDGISNNIVKNPELDDCMKCRGNYTTDAFQGSQGARIGFGGKYLPNVTVPARKKADELLREYRAGAGSPAELGRVLGLGLHNMLDPIFVAASKETAFKGDMLLDGAVAGRLADIIRKDPTLEAEALKYTNKDELDEAKGLKYLFDIQRGSMVAMEKLKGSVEKNQPLPQEERNACIELMLRQRALLIVARRHAEDRENGEKMQEIWKRSEEFNMKIVENKTPPEEQALFGMQIDLDQNRAYGRPEFVRAMGIMGTAYAKRLLDEVMPNRVAFFAKTDAEIVSAFEKSIGSKDDPFQNKEYQRTYRQGEASREAMKDRQIGEKQPTAAVKH